MQQFIENLIYNLFRILFTDTDFTPNVLKYTTKIYCNTVCTYCDIWWTVKIKLIRVVEHCLEQTVNETKYKS